MTDNRAVRGSLQRLGPQRAIPAPLYFVVGALTQYVGAALAVTLFDHLSPSGVAWLRVVFSAVILWIWRRPKWRGWEAPSQRALVAFGVVLAGMNLCFYLAVNRLPLGTAVAIEFSGPIAVAAVGTRTWRNVAALVVAAAGVVLLADVQWSASPLGVALALGAAALWAAYIVLAAAVAGQALPDGSDCGNTVDALDGLAVSLAVGAIVIAPVGVASVWAQGPSRLVVAGCALVGLLSNVIPYGLDLIVLPRLSPSQFALLLSLLPATATVVGVVVLGQIPTVVEGVGVALVVLAVLVRQREQPR